VLGVGVIAGQQPPAAGTFTAAQATAGRQVFEANCASCHRQDLGGSNEAPPLAGVNFVNTWGARPVDLLTTYIQTAMPPSGPRLSTAETLAVTAYVLQANGGQPGPQPLTETTKALIATLATAPPQGAPAAPAPDGPVSGVRGGAATLPPGRGLTVSGEVRNYVPVTDAMLRNPPDGDWLMIRRNYQAWSHSPLNGITAANVRRLKIAWVWAMTEGGASEPTPIVHNGIIYLVNTGNIVQALDGRTGELIWEHSVGPEAIIGQGAMRSMALYQDKLFVATTDARLVALDARTGKLVWDTVIADRNRGFANTSGPIVIKGKVLQGQSGCDLF
jgi:alcohol dehydrogenase (cytochrome c)